jgi:DNA-binding transcriptional LysR family regulator
MYNPQLDTFIRVADAGSFSKAAEENYITPTAVIKQINNLESALGLRLFERSNRGLTLTESGKSLYNDAKYVIKYCKDSVERAKNADSRQESVIRIGTSTITPGEFLLTLWPKIHQLRPEIKLQLIPFENTLENALEILHNLGQNIDIVAGWFDETYEDTLGCASLKLRDDPVYCALSIHNKHASKDKLTISDLRGESLLLPRKNWESRVDRIREFALKQKIEVVDFDFYSLSIFNRCENGNNLLMAFEAWRNAHPLMKILPVEWDFTVPYGLLHSPKPSDTVKIFLDAVAAALAL